MQQLEDHKWSLVARVMEILSECELSSAFILSH
jgi:hypothetical protein